MFNDTCTLFIKTDDGYKTVYVSACYIMDVKAHETKKYGSDNADSLKIIIPAFSVEDGLKITEGSFVSCGEALVTVTDDITVLVKNNVDFYLITSVSDHLAGSDKLQHITIGAK